MQPYSYFPLYGDLDYFSHISGPVFLCKHTNGFFFVKVKHSKQQYIKKIFDIKQV